MMKKFVKASVLATLSLGLVVPAATTSASAKSRVKVISTTSVAKQAYHGKKGNIYTSAKLNKRHYVMKNYKYTTWYVTKQAVIKNNGKKGTLAYVKAGNKAGWIYKKYLTAGKAPVNKAKILANDSVSFNRAMMSASEQIQDSTSENYDSYKDMGSQLTYAFFEYDGDVAEINLDRTAMLKVYNLFEGRFSKSQNADLAAMASQIENLQVTGDNQDLSATKVTTFGTTLGGLIQTLG
ncbi:hypothetical protein [Levilactobacillus enshiensis]|uniref:hypothetical protein n=1 Tax=Levilactobacillus enshiensis TaxID=2590213 RepID=UPI00117A0CA6|nr:hypothetical protein [Levilactobacillus enshiensis]